MRLRFFQDLQEGANFFWGKADPQGLCLFGAATQHKVA